jgi:hypothetical protein
MSEYYFAAGEMTIKEKKVHANPDRGVLRFYMDKVTQLLSMKWENITKNTSNEEIIITAGDWLFKKISTSKGCPFYIQNTSYPDDKYFFYFQTKNKESIEKIEKNLEEIFKTGQLPGWGTKTKEEKNMAPMSIEEMQNNQNNNAQQGISVFKTLSETLKKMMEKNHPSLSDILNREKLTQFFDSLDEETKNRLIQLLPENQRSVQGFYDNINSAQFRQGLGSLTYALESENLSAIITSFKLDMKDAKNSLNGVEAFVKCIIAKYEKKEDKKENEEKKEEKKE